MQQLGPKTPFALEDWIVEPEFNQLSQGNYSRRIEPKVMSVLVRLAAQAQRVVSKDEILRDVWPNTYVGEDALTRCISVLRHTFKDDPHNPRFIKTVSKAGYCLLVTARPVVPAADSAAQIAATAPAIKETVIVPPALATRATRRYRNKIGMATGAATLAVALVAGITTWAVRATRTNAIPPAMPTLQLTTSAGEQSWPALSPDGKRLAFVWAQEDGSPQHIYIKSSGSESLLRLTDLADNEYSPAWSPDGKQLAFLSSSQAGLGLYVASLAPTQSIRKVYIPGETTRWEQGALSWSPDGKSFVLVDHIGAQPGSSIYLINVESMRAHPLTAAPAGWEGDLNPVFSHDGKKIAFLRASESWVMDLYWIAAAGGNPHRITFDGKTISGMTWSADDQSIIFSSDRAGPYALWKEPLRGGVPQRMPVGTEDAAQPAIPQDGRDLAFVQYSAIFGIARLAPSKGAAHGSGKSMVVSSTAQDSAPSVSPDGSQFAFQSWRSGSQQIWVASLDGQSLRQLTPASPNLWVSGSPSWSPDGSRIAFDSRIDGHAHIFVIAAGGSAPKQVTFGELNDIVPRWSADGRSLYFRSNRGGRWQLWKLVIAAGPPQPVTSEDGMAAQESPDGQWLYFARGGESGLWRMPLAGGKPVRILDQPATRYWAYWTVSQHGIYFLDQRKSTPAISIYDPVSRRTSLFAKLDRLPPLYAGLSLLHDGRDILLSDEHDAGSHISLAQGVF